MSDFVESNDDVQSIEQQQSNNVTSVRSISSAEWRTRITNIQREKMSPEVFSQLKERAEKQKRAHRAYKTANILERCNTATARAQESTLKRSYFLSNSSAVSAPPAAPAGGGGMFGMFGRAHTMSAAPSYPSEASRSVVDEEYTRTATRNTSQTKTLQAILLNRKATDVEQMDDSDEEANFNEVNAQLDAMEREINEDDAEADALPAQLASVGLVVTPAAPVAAVGGGGGDGAAAPSEAPNFHTLLQSLAKEPTEAAEVTAKFTIYENYLETVVAIREQTILFWETNRTQFEGHAMTAGDKAIQAIDSPNALSIYDQSYNWFVYDMMCKAHENHRLITNTLAGIRGKLELLTQEEIDCPFCLERVTKENGLVLGCCHKTCKECWMHWQELKGTAAFCPLCRHEDFVQDLLE